MTDDRPVLFPAMARVEKAARPPHVILLSDVISEVSAIEQLGGILVAWYEPTPDGANLQFRSLGVDDAVIGLAERSKLAVIAGIGDVYSAPSDTP